jgi:hypothetical protein
MQHYGYLTRDLPVREINYMNMQKVKKIWHESVMPFSFKCFCVSRKPLNNYKLTAIQFSNPLPGIDYYKC